MPDIRIVGQGQNEAPIIAAHTRSGARGNYLLVAQVNVSGDVVNPGGGSSGGDGAILDGSDTSIKATVKDYASSNPLAVVLVNASGDAYNGNSSTVTVTKWNLTPAQDAVHIHSGIIGVSGDVSTTPKAGNTWPISFSGQVGVQVVGGSIGARVSVSGDQLAVLQQGAWATAITGDVLLRANPGVNIGSIGSPIGVQIVGGSVGGKFSSSGDTLLTREQGVVGVQIVGSSGTGTVGISGDVSVKQTGAWGIAVTGDVLTRAGSLSDPRGPIGVQIVGYSLGTSQIGVSGDVILQQNSNRIIGRIEGPLGVQIVGTSVGTVGVSGDVGIKPGTTIPANTYFPVSGDTGISDGADKTIKATVRDYANSNPLAVTLTNASGDTYNPFPKSRILTTVSGRVTSAGSNTIVAAAGGRKIKVTSYDLQGDGNNARGFFASGASGTALTPEWELQSLDGVAKQVGGSDGTYIFATSAGALLSFESSSEKPMKYSITYHSEDAS